jgi:hypothetical protein
MRAYIVRLPHGVVVARGADGSTVASGCDANQVVSIAMARGYWFLY